MCRKIVFLIGASIMMLPTAVNGQISNASSYLTRGNALANVRNRPTVSPYLNLLNGDGTAASTSGGLGSIGGRYQTLVRPQIEQRQQARQQQAQIQRIQNQLNRNQQAYRRPTSGVMSTGHPTRFRSYSHYYPALGR